MRTRGPTLWSPIAHVTVEDARCRSAIVETLQRSGWSVVAQPTGLHLIRAMSGVILGDRPWLRPKMIVADAVARGCSGATIARGLRDLGLSIPVILIANPDRRPPVPTDRDVTLVDPANAAHAVADLARRLAVGDAAAPRGASA